MSQKISKNESSKFRRPPYPLDEKQVASLILLEEANLSDPLDQGIVHQLAALYSRLLEFYDSLGDPVKLYFTNRLQSALARAADTRHKGKADLYFQKLRAKSNYEASKDKDKDTPIPASPNVKPLKLDFEDPKKQLEMMKNTRAAQFAMSLKLERERVIAAREMGKTLETYHEMATESTQMVRSQLSEQEDALHRKIHQRRQASATKSINRSQELSLKASASSKKLMVSQLKLEQHISPFTLNDEADFSSCASSRLLTLSQALLPRETLGANHVG